MTSTGGLTVRRAALVATAALGIVVLGVGCSGSDSAEPGELVAGPSTTVPLTMPGAVATTAPLVLDDAPPTSAPPTQAVGPWVELSSVGENTDGATGLLTFRGNPTRSFHGTGPIPQDPVAQWRFGGGDALCSFSTVGTETTKWCGTGWTGQPAVFDYQDQRWVVFGSYSPALHFLDASTGTRILDDFPVGDLIKGSVTIDPDGYPLAYFGSRDGFFRVVSFDGGSPRELWKLGADEVEVARWNDDWDGTALVIDDHLFVGGENSNLHIVKLNRTYDSAGVVAVSPELIFDAPGWDDDLLDVIPDGNVSIETSITIVDNTLWFANSGGLVQGWDISGLRDGIDPVRTFRFWTGDDTDASIVVDDEGFLYVGVELERAYSRALEVGQFIKLDPRKPDDPIVWSRDLHARVPDGVWATAAVHRDVIYVPTNEGVLFALDRETGNTRWQVKLPGPVWSSPVVVDDVLIQADCSGVIHAWDVVDTRRDPVKLWTIGLPWCIESTPAVWDGQIFVGHRRGEMWGIGDR